MDIKLKELIKEFALEQDRPKVDKFKVTEAIRNYANVGKALYQSGGILEAAKQLSEMATAAQNHVLSETNDWFDSVSVKRNMKELKGLTGQFKKTAVEANSVNQRLSALYEDMGNILNRYYEIDEAMDPVGKEDGDVDNDGDTDDSDRYLKKRRAAISKAIKKQKNEGTYLKEFETLKEFGPSPMDRALKQTLKDPKSGKEVTVGSIKNQGEKKYSPALVKKANAIFKKSYGKRKSSKSKDKKNAG